MKVRAKRVCVTERAKIAPVVGPVMGCAALAGMLAGALTLGGAVHAELKTTGAQPEAVSALADTAPSQAVAGNKGLAGSVASVAPAIGIGGLLAVLGAFLWRRGLGRAIEPAAREVARATQRVVAPALQVAGDIAGAGLRAAGGGLAGVLRALPKRLRWRFIATVALICGILLLLANGWGVWIGLALIAGGALGLLALKQPQRTPA